MPNSALLLNKLPASLSNLLQFRLAAPCSLFAHDQRPQLSCLTSRLPPAFFYPITSPQTSVLFNLHSPARGFVQLDSFRSARRFADPRFTSTLTLGETAERILFVRWLRIA